MAPRRGNRRSRGGIALPGTPAGRSQAVPRGGIARHHRLKRERRGARAPRRQTCCFPSCYFVTPTCPAGVVLRTTFWDWPESSSCSSNSPFSLLNSFTTEVICSEGPVTKCVYFWIPPVCSSDKVSDVASFPSSTVFPLAPESLPIRDPFALICTPPPAHWNCAR